MQPAGHDAETATREAYFAYGSNLDEGQMRSRCPSASVVGVAVLTDYVISFGGHSRRWNGPVATLAQAEGGRVEGLVYELDSTDLVALDGFEGHPRVYTRKRLTVTLSDGTAREAHVYVHSKSIAGSRPSMAYLDVIRLAYLRLGFDSTLLAAAANADYVSDAQRKRTRVFVYGSLLLGEDNHEVIRGARWVGEARTEPRYTLHDLGEYPGLVEGGDQSVLGELYEVDAATLDRLDEFEGHPRFYRRRMIELEGGGSAQAYVLSEARARGRAKVVDGDWRAHRRREDEQARPRPR